MRGDERLSTSLVGEFRVHYAGFFDLGFGHSAAGGTAAAPSWRVRSHEVPFILGARADSSTPVYERMAARPKALYGAYLKSNYQAQGLEALEAFSRSLIAIMTAKAWT